MNNELIFLQIAEALSFLHIDARMMHRNVCPESVIINEKGEWKLAGFDYAVQGTHAANGQVNSLVSYMLELFCIFKRN